MISVWWLFVPTVMFIIRDTIRYIRNYAGTLRIDRTNPDHEVYKIEIEDLDKLAKRKFIILRVDNKAKFSQK